MSDGHCYRAGEFVVYRVQKHSSSPGPRAKDVAPEPQGEQYSYCVEKYWTVAGVDGQKVMLITRRGKYREVAVDDPNLRAATWWERFFFRDRFPQLESLTSARPA